MLTFEEKLTIIEAFPTLKRKDVSLGRVNFQFPDSVLDKKNIVYHLHPNGNGYVYAELLNNKNDYDVDAKGMVNIRDFSAIELRKIIHEAIESLSEQEPFQETWINRKNQILDLINDYDSWNVYAGEMLDGTFSTYNAAVDYLEQEGFKRR
ncbi:hypothetical protein J2T56_000625 [Natronobacillus azotifigens]|uniref:Uncharacterized protein n=1 Tax=Natronobacillus azotifigens TaxID=472978 RepID=A0A9J6RBQ3_9BACI|nr:hypothetical protein [Natronobacillus azotifigens]MCZ0702657.1 hypothetical protein [Natronobacillus azotifigens]